MRQIVSLCEDWRFQKGASLPEAFPVEWENVRLPHTWNVEDGQDGGNDYWRGTAFYAKRFGCPQLEVGGRAARCECGCHGECGQEGYGFHATILHYAAEGVKSGKPAPTKSEKQNRPNSLPSLR